MRGKYITIYFLIPSLSQVILITHSSFLTLNS